MKGIWTLRHVAVAAIFFHHALALPQAGGTVDPSPLVWVTVDASGSASTISPAVITTEGHKATVSPAPSNLRTTATYTLSPDGRASTYTGVAPVASATGTGDSLAGVFPACNSNADVGPVEPFCLPKAGSELHPGKTYYITWSPSYFSPPDLPVYLQAFYSPSNSTTSSSSNSTTDLHQTPGSTSPQIPASKGFHPFTLPPDFLSSRGNPSQYTITFVLAYADDGTPANNDLIRRVGPVVYVTEDRDGPSSGVTPGGSGSGGSSAVAIAVPVVVVAVLVILGAFCVLSWRKSGQVPVIGAIKRRSASGYGVRQSRAERVGVGAAGAGVGAGPGAGPWGDNKSETNVGIQLTDRDSWSPTGRTAVGAELRSGGGGDGRNVFRDEVERQARMR